MKKLENLKNKEIKNLSNIRGALKALYPTMTERKDGDCHVTDVIHYDDKGNEIGRKDITISCPL